MLALHLLQLVQASNTDPGRNAKTRRFDVGRVLAMGPPLVLAWRRSIGTDVVCTWTWYMVLHLVSRAINI